MTLDDEDIERIAVRVVELLQEGGETGAARYVDAALVAQKLGVDRDWVYAHVRDSWLDVGRAAEHLSCPRSRIYALVSARRIPHHKDGSRLLFRREELDEWVRAGGGKRP